MMTNGDPEGQIILSYPHMNNGFFLLAHHCFLFKNMLPEVPEYTLRFHMMTSLYSALDKLLGKLGIYATWLSSIAYFQKQLRIFIFFYATFFSVITPFLNA